MPRSKRRSKDSLNKTRKLQRRNYQEDDKERKVKNGRIEKKRINKNVIKPSVSTINRIREQKVKYIKIKRLDPFFREDERETERARKKEVRLDEEYYDCLLYTSRCV